MAQGAQVKFLQPIEVRALLQDPQRRDKLLILDVRDDDFEGGHIRANHHLNLPSYKLSCLKTLDEFIRLDLHSGIDTVIVHCYLSQQRGPTAARRCARHPPPPPAITIFSITRPILTPSAFAHLAE